MKKKFFSAALAAAMVVTSVFSTTSVAGAAENETAVPYGKVTVEQKDNTVTIGNDAIKRTFSTADKKLSTTEIVNKRTGGEGTTFTPQEGSEEFVVKRQSTVTAGQQRQTATRMRAETQMDRHLTC